MEGIKTMGRFKFLREEKAVLTVTAAEAVCLRTAVLVPFSLPVRDRAEVNNALRLKYRSLCGQENALLSVTQIFSSGKAGTEGISWFISSAEAKENDALYPGRVIIPAPLAFVPESDESVAVVCKRGNEACGILYSDRKPLIYRYTEEEPEALAEWLSSYAAGIKQEEVSAEIYDMEKITRTELEAAIKKSSELLPGLALLNFSDHAINDVQKRENLMKLSSAMLSRLMAAGLIFAALSCGLFVYAENTGASAEGAPENIYRTIFGKSTASPVSSLNREFRRLSGGSGAVDFPGILSGIAESWAKDSSMTIDTMRYGKERTELNGSAKKTADVQSFREALEKHGFKAETGAIEQSGSKVRFTIFITGVKK